MPLITADKILTATKCGDIFPYDRDNLKANYKELMRMYHPDVSDHPKAAEITTHINELYDRALELTEQDEWEKTDTAFFRTGERKISCSYYAQHIFELGIIYISSTKVIYVLESQHERYYDNALKSIKHLSYKDNKMKKEFSRYFPKIYDHFKLNDGRFVIVLEKTSDVLYLPDVYNYLNKQIPDKHIAWIVSRLSSIICYFNFSNTTHNGISFNNLFISPEHHSVMLYGGWWYAVPTGAPLIGTQNEIYNIMPVTIKSTKVGDIITDLESVKLIGRNLIKSINAPIPISQWLKSASGHSPFDEFSQWNDALDKAYGKRKFIELNVSENNLYKK